jgi:hypothetical protein
MVERFDDTTSSVDFQFHEITDTAPQERGRCLVIRGVPSVLVVVNVILVWESRPTLETGMSGVEWSALWLGRSLDVWLPEGANGGAQSPREKATRALSRM